MHKIISKKKSKQLNPESMIMYYDCNAKSSFIINLSKILLQYNALCANMVYHVIDNILNSIAFTEE
jgi:hypothetical protein